MKYFIGAFLVVVLITGYFLNKSNKEDAERLKQAEVAYQEKLNTEKHESDIGVKIKEIQSKIEMDEAIARKIIESEKIPDEGKRFYADISSRWADSIKVATSTPRTSLAQPVAELQKIKRELEERKPLNPCDEIMKHNVYMSFDYAIDGFLDFMKNNEYGANTKSDLSNEYAKKSSILIDYCYA
ncbi:hypothetical protein RFI02_11310 [Acinetobacter sichuanensis]|uniref:hypothetical protein n=1 Tax=Acinetobacter sichuanensis TaxID=2136183 RepID=UPI00280E01B1|nr:hypothetical protein [Acinetobacter sichuanensis]MDQ9021696.1 hypothetical protein [Acinetobacter sichuanensis]